MPPYKKGTSEYNNFLTTIKNNSGVTVNGADIIDSYSSNGIKFYVCMFTEPSTTDYSVVLPNDTLPPILDIFLVGGGGFNREKGGAGGEVVEQSIILDSTYAGTYSITVGDGAYSGDKTNTSRTGTDSKFYNNRKIYTAEASIVQGNCKTGKNCTLSSLGNYLCDSDHGVNPFKTYYWGGDGGYIDQINAPSGGGGGGKTANNVDENTEGEGDKNGIHNGSNGDKNRQGNGGKNTGGGAGGGLLTTSTIADGYGVHGGSGIVVLCFTENSYVTETIRRIYQLYLYTGNAGTAPIFKSLLDAATNSNSAITQAAANVAYATGQNSQKFTTQEDVNEIEKLLPYTGKDKAPNFKSLETATHSDSAITKAAANVAYTTGQNAIQANETNIKKLYQFIKSQNDVLSQNIKHLTEMYSTDDAQTNNIDEKYQTLKTVNFYLFIIYFCFLGILLFFLFRTVKIGAFVKILIALCFGAYPFVAYYIENSIYVGIMNLYTL